jgi:hypothetical protein
MVYKQIPFDKKWDFRDVDSWRKISVLELPKCFSKLRRQPTAYEKAFQSYMDGTILIMPENRIANAGE